MSAVPGFVSDFRHLFFLWTQEPGNTFADFRKVWIAHQMSFIHAAKLDALDLETYMKLLYGAVYAYLITREVKTQLGALYGLYMTYCTQQYQPKVQIPVTPVLWNNIKDLLLKDVPMEAKAIFSLLRRSNAFYFTALVEILPPPHFWPTPESRIRPELINADTLTGVLDIEPLSDLVKKYNDTKTALSNDNSSVDLVNPEFVNLQIVNNIQDIIISNSRYSKEQLEIENQRRIQHQRKLRQEEATRQFRKEQQQQLKRYQDQIVRSDSQDPNHVPTEEELRAAVADAEMELSLVQRPPGWSGQEGQQEWMYNNNENQDYEPLDEQTSTSTRKKRKTSETKKRSKK